MRVVGSRFAEVEPQWDSSFDRTAPSYRPIPDAAHIFWLMTQLPVAMGSTMSGAQRLW